MAMICASLATPVSLPPLSPAAMPATWVPCLQPLMATEPDTWAVQSTPAPGPICQSPSVGLTPSGQTVWEP